MRAKTTFAITSILLLLSAGAKAQDVPEAKSYFGQINLGFRTTSFSENSDKARFQRYQDLSNGPTFDLFKLTKDTNKYLFKLQADHVGYGDQRFSASYNNFGKVKATFEWDQIPLYYSDSTRTLYSSSMPGVLSIDDAIQEGIQNKTLTLTDAVAGASVFNLKSRRDIADFKLSYDTTRNVVLNMNFKNTQRNGTQPWGTSFGIGGAVASELPVPIDHRTTELGANLEYSNDTVYGRIGYDGSFFRNNITTLTWDNPVRISDGTAGPAMARESLWPNTNQNTVSAMGGLNLLGHSHATAYVSVGQLSNNDPLLPFTINTALPVIALDRDTAQIQARVTAMNYTFTTHPTKKMWFSTRYRQYEFNNQTVPFAVGQSINFDTSVVALNKESEPLGYTRHTLDTDASYSPVRYLGFRTGYTREEVNRTYRFIEDTIENTGRVSVDLTGVKWLTLRGIYEHSKRTGSPIATEELLAIGEQPSLRQFDIADRNKDRFNTILVLIPVSQFSVNLSAGIGKELYPSTDTRTVFGLRSNNNRTYSAGFDFVPIEKISLGASLGYEKYNAIQASRTASPLPANASLDDLTQQWNDPRRDWTDNSADQVRIFNSSIDLLKIIPRTDIKIAYDQSKGQSTYVYSLPADTVLAAPVPLPPITNKLQRGTVDGKYAVTKHASVGLLYLYEKYGVNDFALSPLAGLTLPATNPGIMMLGYYYRPYTANMVMGRLTYTW